MNSAATRKKRDHKSCTDIIALPALREVAGNQLLHCTLLIQLALLFMFYDFSRSELFLFVWFLLSLKYIYF